MTKMQNQENQAYLDDKFMQIAIDEAKIAASEGEVPIGACVVYEDKVIARAHNLREINKDPHAHAEFLALEEAAKVLDRWRLSGCCVYVTLEPCLMCAGLMVNSRVDRCVWGTSDPKAGALGTLYELNKDQRLNHEFEVLGNVRQEECAGILKEFFKMRRKQNKEKKFQFTDVPENTELDICRAKIDLIDKKLAQLFIDRMHVVEVVAKYKKKNDLEVLDSSRENEKMKSIEGYIPDIYEGYAKQMLDLLMKVSKERQKELFE